MSHLNQDFSTDTRHFLGGNFLFLDLAPADDEDPAPARKRRKLEWKQGHEDVRRPLDQSVLLQEKMKSAVREYIYIYIFLISDCFSGAMRIAQLAGSKSDNAQSVKDATCATSSPMIQLAALPRPRCLCTVATSGQSSGQPRVLRPHVSQPAGQPTD